MRAMQISAMASILLLVLTGSASAQPGADPREKLETAIPEAIRLLEAEDYQTFLKNFVNPADYKKILEQVTLEEFAEGFAEDKAERLLEVLKEIQKVEPTYDEKKTKATFELKEPIGGKRDIAFVKVDQYWYIKN